RAQGPADPFRILAHHVEDALPVFGDAGALRRVEREIVGAEEALKYLTRIVLRRHRRGRSAPGDAVGIRAAISRVAVADGAHVFEPELERREARLRSHGLGGDL